MYCTWIGRRVVPAGWVYSTWARSKVALVGWVHCTWAKSRVTLASWVYSICVRLGKMAQAGWVYMGTENGGFGWLGVQHLGE
jgi:hypothetical protein